MEKCTVDRNKAHSYVNWGCICSFNALTLLRILERWPKASIPRSFLRRLLSKVSRHSPSTAFSWNTSMKRPRSCWSSQQQTSSTVQLVRFAGFNLDKEREGETAAVGKEGKMNHSHWRKKWNWHGSYLLKGIVSRYKQWLLLYLDLVYGEPRTNRVLNRACSLPLGTSLQRRSKAYDSDARVNDQLDRCLCPPLELLSIVAAAHACELKGEAVP